jgi:two-component system, NtrC family, nitrogen regulation sensor histidine kinase NtrY
MLESKAREQIVEIVLGGEARTLAVKITQDELGHVLTFDDITSQLMDQRRAAWADVARRIAHEIKNPLTPIQLAADRLKRRFSKEIQTDPAMFERLTDTIVRQVTDLRRMVDEFSSFARMPKPVFHDEAMIDICRQAVFLHEVAHPEIDFGIDAPDPLLRMICDRRQLSQALTNMVKNGVEAIEAKRLTKPEDVGKICVHLSKSGDGHIILSVTDNGIGLPLQRDRLVEPYMTTRERGTGLGLAIVKKIVEEHGGSMGFADRPGGGTCVTLIFDQSIVYALSTENDVTDAVEAAQKAPKRLTRIGNK